MDSFEWTLYWLILAFKITFLVSIPLIYININFLGFTKKNLRPAIIIGAALAILLYLIDFYWAFYLFNYGWSDITYAKLYLRKIGYEKFVLFSMFDSFLNIGIPEEIFFRGFIFSIIKRKLNLKYAIAISSIIFALCHVDRPTHMPLMLIHGIILSYAFYKIKNIVLPIIAHSISNVIPCLQVIWI